MDLRRSVLGWPGLIVAQLLVASCGAPPDPGTGKVAPSATAVPIAESSATTKVTSALVALGVPCASAAQCTSGFCVDGVCCNTACGGGATSDCQACSASAGASGANGLCSPVVAGIACRAASGACDLSEFCNGTATTCPADRVAGTGTICRATTGPCDVADHCDGTLKACPADALRPSTFVCRASAGPCDVAERCTGTSSICPDDAFQPASVTCRAQAGACDVAETCTGSSAACPADAVAVSGSVCRAASGVCDLAEQCDGTLKTCPADVVVQAGVLCRASAGVCDTAESCNGTAKACPADRFLPTVTVCRASTGPCDIAETCPGGGPICPADALRPSTFTCRASAGTCDVVEKCTGTAPTCPVDAFQSSSVICRAQAGVCDIAETCTGSSALCPADAVAAGGTICRAATNLCDVAEQCTGTTKTCPADAVAPAGAVCRAAAGACDAAEICSGTTKACPADRFFAAGIVCRLATGTCDVAERCPGNTANCPADIVAANGSPCSDGDACTVSDACSSGTCVGSNPVTCAAPGPCHAAGACDHATGQCTNPVLSDGTACNDGVGCTRNDQCQTGVCAGTPGASVRMLVADSRSGAVFEYDIARGSLTGTFIPPGLGGISSAVGLAVHDGYLFVSNYDPTGSTILRYNLTTGTPAPSTGNPGARFASVTDPDFLRFGPDGNIYTPTNTFGRVDRYQGESGAPLPAPGFEGTATFALTYQNTGVDFGPDGKLYVANFAPPNVWRMDPTSGAFIDEFVSNNPIVNGSRLADLLWGPDGNLYVGGRGPSDVGVGDVRRYAPDGQPFPAPGKPGALFTDTGQIVSSLAFGPDGFLYVSTWTYAGPTDLLKVDPTSGDIVTHLPLPASDTGPGAMVFAPGRGALDCDDHNPCTADSCDPMLDCLHAAVADGISCSLPNATAVCAAGLCAVASCQPGYGDCDSAAGTGCEAALDKPATCGTCDSASLNPLTGIVIEPPAANIVGTGSTSLRAYGYYAGAPGTAVDITDLVHWTIPITKPPSHHTIRVDAAGTVTGDVIGVGTVAASIGPISRSANVRVWDPDRYAALTSLQIAGIPANLSHGNCFQTNVTAGFSDGSEEDVTATARWSLGPSQRLIGQDLWAAVGPHSEGYQSAVVYLVPGDLTGRQDFIGIWGPAFNGGCSDPRVPGDLWGITVGSSSTSIWVGEATGLSAAGYYSDGSVRDISESVIWGAADSSLLDVSSDGYATGRAVGSGRVLASLRCDPGVAGITGGSPLAVTAADELGTLTSLRLQPSAANIVLGAGFRLQAFATYSAAPGRTINVSAGAEWVSYGTNVSFLLGGFGVATGVGPADVTVRVFTAPGVYSARAGSIRVWDPARLASLTSIGLAGATSMAAGTCQQWQLVGTFSTDPATEDLAQSALWSPPVGQFGTLSPTGLYCAGSGGGYDTISASMGRGLLSPAVAEFGVW